MTLEKFKELSLKKKIEWIIQYYGIWIVVGIVAIFVTVDFVRTVFFPAPISDICIAILSDDYSRDDVPTMEKEISALTGGSASIVIYNESEAYGISAFTVKVMADQIDLIIAPKTQTDSMNESSYLSSCEKLDGTELYLSIPTKAREGEMLDKTIDYFKER